MDTLQTLPAAATVAPPTLAERAAARHWSANRRALAHGQPALVERWDDAPPASLAWVFGRDGSLTATDAAGRWWAGCSLPLRAARAALGTMEVRGTVSCFLAPSHAGYVRAALDRLGPERALLVVSPDAHALRVMLACDDVSAEVAAGRLWVAGGDGWADEVRRVLAAHPGLPTPAQFVREPGVETEAIEPLIEAAQQVFADALNRRAAEMAAARRAWRPSGRASVRRLCVVGRRHFRLWDDAGDALFRTLAQTSPDDVECVALWTDDPATSAPPALAAAALACDAVVAADLARADAAPDLLPVELPWVTWVTAAARVPAFTPAAPRDALLLADPAWRGRASALGWPDDRIAVAGWPAMASADDAGDDNGAASRFGVSRAILQSGPAVRPLREGLGDAPIRPGKRTTCPDVIPTHDASPRTALALVADVGPLAPPARVEEYSSHRLLWEAIAAALRENPFAVGRDPDAYLAAQRARFGVSDDALDRDAFVAGLILPAYAQGVARVLLAGGVPLRLHGRGWPDLPEFAPHAAGPVADRRALADAVAAAAGLVRAWPGEAVHPLAAAGRPVVVGHDRASLLRAARRAVAGRRDGSTARPVGPALAAALLGLLKHTAPKN